MFPIVDQSAVPETCENGAWASSLTYAYLKTKINRMNVDT
jgi:hypothetical protein